MRKNKREDSNQPGAKGLFYYQKKCFSCGKLIWGSSPKSRKMASKDCYFKMKAHKEEHQKEKQGRQLELSIPGREEKQAQAVRKVTLREDVSS